MHGTGKVNPLDRDALTSDSVTTGDRLISWRPGVPASTRRLTIINDPYIDDDGDMVVDVRHDGGRETTELTSEIGLSGDRYSGEWSHIARRDEETDD